MTVTILTGDCRDVLRTLPAESVHCVVTSPPYWGLRDYGVAGQLGMEDTYGEHVETITGIFREIRRVLRSDGTLWLNYGDSYATSVNGRSAADVKALGNDDRTFRDKPFSTIQGVLKRKDLCGMPWRVAFALQADGWYLRQDIIWSKPNPMPESVTDRCTKAHEYLFLLAKRERYYYDADAIKEDVADSQQGRIRSDVVGGKSWNERQQHSIGGTYETRSSQFRRSRADGGLLAMAGESSSRSGAAREGGASLSSGPEMARPDELFIGQFRNRRSVWEVTTQPFPEAHFATFPTALIEPCIKAGTSEKGCCGKCGATWVRQTVHSFEPTQNPNFPKGGKKGLYASNGWGETPRGVTNTKTLGWSPSCRCDAAVVPATVLDPFAGAGTTGLVADRLQRSAILIELNPEYAALARRRIVGDAPLFASLVEAAP